MSLRDLIGERRLVVVAGRRFIVRPPTVRTFYLALECFGSEIAIVRSAARKAEGGLSVAVAVAPFLTDPGHTRLARVLKTCVEFPIGLEGDFERVLADDDATAMELALTVADMIDVKGLDAMLTPPDAQRVEPGESDGPSDESALVFGCAERFHIDPMAVMEWPAGVFADVVAAFSRPEPQAAGLGGVVLDGMAAFKAGQKIGG